MSDSAAGRDWLKPFEALTDQLIRHRQFWQQRAFHQPRLPWDDQHRDLVGALDTLDLETAERWQSDTTTAAAWLTQWLPWANELVKLCELPQVARAPEPLSERLARDMPGRKRQQIEAFAAALDDRGLPLLEWCAGKGHLCRALSSRWQARAAAGLEWQPQLVAAGNRLALRSGLPVRLHQCDVVGAGAQQFLVAPRHVVALHACGELHTGLLRVFASARTSALALSPCCYHLTSDPVYRPLSRAGRRLDPGLTRDQLRTAVQETVTAPAGACKQRRRLQQWRLGFDLLQRDLRGSDDYLDVPSLPQALAGSDFETFCRHVAQRQRIELGAKIDWERYEAAGERRFRQVTARDLVRMLFRRPLELWLVLDQLLYLQDCGYRVKLEQFCPHATSPRNLLLQAWR